jgi:Mg2+ and Co2+ transporter CorA
MSEMNQNEMKNPVQNEPTKSAGQFLLFDNLNLFEKAVTAESHIDFNFESLIQITGDFVESKEEYLIMNIKDNVESEPNNILFLTENRALLYAKRLPNIEKSKAYKSVLVKPFGHSTILSLIVFNKIMNDYKSRLESLIVEIKDLEHKFSLEKYRNLALEFERRHDRIEELIDLIIRLQERVYPQVDTEYISFDYRVLIAECTSLEGRYRRRLGTLRDLRQDFETQATTELNQKIANLNDVVRKLTAITVILMLPTLIASHFGMNFQHMPELAAAWAYPAVIGLQVALMGAGLFLFRKIGWL